MSAPEGVPAAIHPWLREIHDAPHGGQKAAPGTPQVVDLSSNVLPAGPSPTVRAAAQAAVIEAYPHPRGEPLRGALATAYGVATECLLLCNGAAEGIAATALAALGPGRLAVVAAPAFGEYARASLAAGASVIEVRADEPDFAHDAFQICRAAQQASIVWLATPANPTGRLTHFDEIVAVARAASNALVVVDEAYAAMASGHFPPAAMPANVVLLRSLTKDVAIPGLRLGCLVARPPVIEALQALLPPWNVGAPAIAAGLASLDSTPWIAASVAEARQAADALAAALRRRGVHTPQSSTTFLLAKVGDGAAFQRALLQLGWAVRDCASFGLTEWVRIAAPRADHVAPFLSAWDSVPK